MNELTETQKSILEAAIGHTDGSIHPLPEHIRGGAARKVIDSLHRQGLIEADDPDTWRLSAEGYRAIATKPTSGNTESCEIIRQGILVHEVDAPPEGIIEGLPPLVLNGPDGNEATGDFTETPVQNLFGSCDDWMHEVDQDFLAIAKKHFTNLNWESWPAIRNTIEEAYALGYEQAKSKPKRESKSSRGDSKQARVIELMKRPEGATLAQIAEETAWNFNTIRGFISTAKKKLGMEITAQRTRTAGPNQQGSPGAFSTYYAS
ncbi:MAG: DUF3489 domain-containing protein [Magnetococcales bacterium]|nr:DUF3489 domain-containing protein [Magnetococcales bacterium]